MKQFVCWSAERVDRYVGQGVEEKTSLASVLERHVEVDLHRRHVKRVSESEEEADFSESTEGEFLESFLGETGASTVFGLIGEAGHGKTHLVHWVHAKLREEGDRRELILIPRTETSLPKIFERLLAVVPEGKREPFREIEEGLRGYVASDVNPADRRLELFNKLQEVLSLGISLEGSGSASDRAQRQYNKLVDRRMIEEFLVAPPVSRFLKAEDGVLDHVVHGSLMESNDEVEDEAEKDRRSFRAADLPIEKWISELTAENQAEAKAAANIFKANPTLLETLLNRGVEVAIQDFMRKYVGDSPESFLVSIRKAIGAAFPGREIILLIEDLARTKFVDEDLVKACTADAAAGDSEMAPMRTLFATTNGLYKTLQQSTRERISRVYVLGRDWGAQGQPWLKFGSRYLGLFRDVEGGCANCEYRSTCFDSFGSRNDSGLYPFTPALLTSVARGALDGRGSAFHPRRFLQKLAEDMRQAAHDVSAGTHPRERFGDLESLEGGKDPKVALFVEGLGLKAEAQRTIRALKAYGAGVASERRVPDAAALAFDLDPRIASDRAVSAPAEQEQEGKETATPQAPKEDPQSRSTGAVQTSDPPTTLDPIAEQVRDWQNGEKELIGNSQEAMEKAAWQQLSGAPHLWESRQIPPLVRTRVMAERSLMFRDSDAAKKNKKSLEVQVTVPLEEDENTRASDRDPWRLLYQLSKNDSKSQRLGWQALDAGEQVDIDQYLRLTETQDSVLASLEAQLEEVLGGRREQAAVAIQALMDVALDDRHLSLKLPEELTSDKVLKFLNEAAFKIDKEHWLESTPAKALQYVASWKEGGGAVIADLYHLSAATDVLCKLDRPLPQGDPGEIKGRYLGQLLDSARSFPGNLQAQAEKVDAQRTTLAEVMQSGGMADWGEQAMSDLKSALLDLMHADLGTQYREPLRQLESDLQALEGHGIELNQTSGGADDYAALVARSGPDAERRIRGSLNFLKRLEDLLNVLERDYPDSGGDLSSFDEAEKDFNRLADELMDKLASGGADR
jgi:hypothetical protein